MKPKTPLYRGARTLLSMALAATAFCTPVLANTNHVTLIEMGDLHGTLVPHAAVLTDGDGNIRAEASVVPW